MSKIGIGVSDILHSESGQVTEAFATVIVLFAGFIGIGGLAFIASVAYIQPVMRALGF